MIQINGKTYLKPSEIAQQGLIVNTKGKSDYKFILNLIKSGRLPALRLNDDTKKTPYYAVDESAVREYNDNITGGN